MMASASIPSRRTSENAPRNAAAGSSTPRMGRSAFERPLSSRADSSRANLAFGVGTASVQVGTVDVGPRVFELDLDDASSPLADLGLNAARRRGLRDLGTLQNVPLHEAGSDRVGDVVSDSRTAPGSWSASRRRARRLTGLAQR